MNFCGIAWLQKCLNNALSQFLLFAVLLLLSFSYCSNLITIAIRLLTTCVIPTTIIITKIIVTVIICALNQLFIVVVLWLRWCCWAGVSPWTPAQFELAGGTNRAPNSAKWSKVGVVMGVLIWACCFLKLIFTWGNLHFCMSKAPCSVIFWACCHFSGATAYCPKQLLAHFDGICCTHQ